MVAMSVNYEGRERQVATTYHPSLYSSISSSCLVCATDQSTPRSSVWYKCYSYSCLLNHDDKNFLGTMCKFWWKKKNASSPSDFKIKKKIKIKKIKRLRSIKIR